MGTFFSRAFIALGEAILLVAIALLLCVSDLQAKEFNKTKCWFEIPRDREMTCGTLSVPENRRKEGGAEITLSVVVFEPERERHEPIVFLTGGPGQPTEISNNKEIEAWWQFISAQSWMIGRRVVVADQRGIGRSNPSLDCDRFFQADHWNAILRSVDAENSFSKLTKDEVLACRSALVAKGIDLAAYNTAENAADIDDLRKALGIEKWVLYGVSYGTRLALEVMDQHPEGVMASILDSVLPLDINYRDEDGPNLDRSMTILERDCLKSQNCMPDLKGALKTISKQLDKQPVLLRSHDNEPRYRYVSGADFIDLVFGLFYDREGIEMLPALIESTFKQDFRPLAEMVFEGEDGGVSQGMDYSITCSESARPDLTRMRSQYWASWVEADDYNWACPLWLVEKAPIARLRPHALIIPTLLLAGEYDPATPSHWAFHAAKNLPHGQVVVFRGIGHDVIDSDPCGSEVVADFLADPNRKVKTGCIDKMEAPRFAVGAEGLSEIGDGATRD